MCLKGPMFKFIPERKLKVLHNQATQNRLLQKRNEATFSRYYASVFLWFFAEKIGLLFLNIKSKHEFSFKSANPKLSQKSPDENFASFPYYFVSRRRLQ